jgi:hypothetical protein
MDRGDVFGYFYFTSNDNFDTSGKYGWLSYDYGMSNSAKVAWFKYSYFYSQKNKQWEFKLGVVAKPGL